MASGYKLNDFALDADEFRSFGIKRYYLKDDPGYNDGEGFSAEEVRDMIYSGQYASGGRVGLMKGAMPMDEDEEDSYRAGVMSAMMGRKKVMGGGMMEMPTGIMRMNQGGVMERDYRDQGGFVPVGIKEKADDVPAMLSKNEFVMTADAVRAAGGGSVQKGAQKMYDTMKSLERKVV